MISDKKHLEIANICYANVAGEFAMFTNPKYRGPNFTWDRWVKQCEESAADWMFIHGVRGHKETVKATAKQYALEIAQRLASRAGLV